MNNTVTTSAAVWPNTSDIAISSDTIMSLEEAKLWGNIRRAAKDNITLKAALDDAVVIYYLSRHDKNF